MVGPRRDRVVVYAGQARESKSDNAFRDAITKERIDIWDTKLLLRHRETADSDVVKTGWPPLEFARAILNEKGNVGKEPESLRFGQVELCGTEITCRRGDGGAVEIQATESFLSDPQVRAMWPSES